MDRGELYDEEIGEPMVGAMILGVPRQNEPIPDKVARYADENNVYIEPYETHLDAGELP